MLSTRYFVVLGGSCTADGECASGVCEQQVCKLGKCLVVCLKEFTKIKLIVTHLGRKRLVTDMSMNWSRYIGIHVKCSNVCVHNVY